MNAIRRDISSRSFAPRRAAALIVTLWIVLALAAIALTFARAMRVERLATANHVAAIEAEAIAQGALQYVIARLDGRNGVPPTEADVPGEAVSVGKGFFWILRPPATDETVQAYGIVDEASKISLNAASPEMLMKLPGMTTDVAAAILDWRDPDSTVTPEGAESDYYLLLSPPYLCKDSSFETVEELMLVRGVTRNLLYGSDANRNGLIDAHEADPESRGLTELGDSGGRGIAHFVTAWTMEANRNTQGQARVNVNTASPAALSSVLRRSLSGDRLAAVLDRAQSQRPFRSVLDFYVRTEMTDGEFNPIADLLTTRRERMLLGLLNINTAPREALACLPGLDEGDADSIIARRGGRENQNSLTWVAEAISKEKAAAIGEYLTTRSYQYSADIVALSGDGRAFKRYRAVVDTRVVPPRVVYWKDLTHLGWPLPAEVREAVRQGEMNGA